MVVGHLPTIPQQLHKKCLQISIKLLKLSSLEVSKNSGKTSARSTTLSEGERIGCERPLVTLTKIIDLNFVVRLSQFSFCFVN